MKTACISFAQGCPRSLSDAARLVDYFVANGWEITTKFQEADLVLVGTCGVTAEAERSSMRFLSMAQKRKPKNAQLIVFGCLAGINKNRIVNELGAVPVSRTDLSQLDSLINADINLNKINYPNNLHEYSKYIRKSFNTVDKAVAKIKDNLVMGIKLYSKCLQYLYNRESLCFDNSPDICNIRIAVGCNNHCTYCAIRKAVGSLQSRPEEEILNEYHAGLANGYNLFRFLAEDVGAYGQDNGTNIASLLLKLLSSNSVSKLQLFDFSPNYLVKYFLELFNIPAH